MKNLKNRMTKVRGVLMTFFMALVFFVSLGYGGEIQVANAAEEYDFLEKTTYFDVTKVMYKDANIKGTDTPVYYDDGFSVYIAWAFDDFEFEPGSTFVYQLPQDITFSDVTNRPIMKQKTDPSEPDVQIGTYSISSNVLRITYTDEEFCRGSQKVGEMSLDCKVVSDPSAENPQKTVIATFTNDVSIPINVIPVPTEGNMEIHNRLYDTNITHEYSNVIRFTSHSNNTNIVLTDEMYPGMYLKTMPVLYSDSDCTVPVDTSRYTVDTSVTQIDGRNVRITIDSMSDGETLYMKDIVGINDDMYDRTTADTFVSKEENKKYYPNQYEGRVDNCASIISDQTVAYDQNRGSGNGVRTSWTDVITLTGSFNKWGVPESNKDGYLNWEIVVYGIYGESYNTGYVLDTIPANSTFVMDSVKTSDNLNGTALTGFVSPEVVGEDSDGNTMVKINFTEAMMTFLKSSPNAHNGVIIEYKTKINTQSDKSTTYYNTATINFEGINGKSKKTSVEYIKSDELVKVSKYTKDTAPNVEYAIIINPDTLDLDPDTDELVLEDCMDPSFDFVQGTLVINSVAATDQDYIYDAQNRKLTLKLADKTAYLIQYEARVNLVPGEQLGSSNGNNTVTLSASSMNSINYTNTVNSEVFTSSASSSSVTGSSINIIKHDKSSTNDVLSGAKFSLTPMLLDSSRTATADSSMQALSGTTDANGSYSFGDLKRGKVYMLTEEEAPQGYERNTEPTFYAFKTNNITEGDITYNGKTYKLEVIDKSKLSYNVFVANEKESTKTDETTPNETTTDDKTKGGSAINVDDPTEEKTETTPETTTETTTEAQKDKNVSGGDNKTNTEVPAMGTTNVEEPKKDAEAKKDDSSTPAETPKKEEAPRSSSSVRTGDGTLFAVVIIVMAVSFFAIVGLVMYKRKHDNE